VKALLRTIFPRKNPDLFAQFTQSSKGNGRQKIGARPPTRKSPIFFFTKRLNSLKLRATYDTGVPTQASDSFEFLAEAESFWEVHSAISGGAGEQRTRRELFIF
jgi:hypothetical protein